EGTGRAVRSVGPVRARGLPADRAAAGRELVAVVPRISAGHAAPGGGGGRPLPVGFLPAERRNLRVRGVEPRNLEPGSVHLERLRPSTTSADPASAGRRS